ncbi:MAG: diacylglycerol kinase [Actinobacteria bacterium]|nr:diacylglycerol kinase [Actinomycetota bacterium]
MRGRPLVKSFNYSIDGIIYVLRSQRNMRIHVAAAALVLSLGLIFNIGRIEYLTLFFAIALVIIAELFNTAIEATIDLTTGSFDPLAQVAKDVSAAGVLVAALNSLVVAYFVFYKRLNPVTLSALQKVREQPLHVTMVALLLVTIVVLAAKAAIGGRDFLRGGWPSGHSALAGALFTAIAVISGNALVATLGLIMAVLVLHSRVEAGIHTYLEIVSGIAIGILVTIIVFQLFF